MKHLLKKRNAKSLQPENLFDIKLTNVLKNEEIQCLRMDHITIIFVMRFTSSMAKYADPLLDVLILVFLVVNMAE